MRRVLYLALSITAACGQPATSPEDHASGGQAAGAPGSTTPTAIASSSATSWAEVTAPRDATLLTALGTVHGIGPAAGGAVTSPFPGRVRALHVAPGDRVEAGTALVDVDVPELAVAAAEALGAGGEAAVHHERLESLRPLLDEGLVRVEQLHESEHLLAEVNTRRRVAVAKLRAAGLDDRAAARVAQRGFITLESPIEGTVIAVDTRLGAAATTDVPLVRVAGQGEVRVEARLPQPFEGEARLRTPHGPVELRPIGPAVRDPESGLWVAFFAPTAEGHGLRDGERHPIELEGAAEGDVVEVPASALRVRTAEGAPARSAEVLRRRGNERAWVAVTVVRVDGASAIVRSPDLAVGDAVAVDPAAILGGAADTGHGH